MKNRMNVAERVRAARTKLREYETRVKDLRRALDALERTIKGLEPHVRKAVDQTRVVGRGVRAGLRAGAATYRAGRRK